MDSFCGHNHLHYHSGSSRVTWACPQVVSGCSGCMCCWDVDKPRLERPLTHVHDSKTQAFLSPSNSSGLVDSQAIHPLRSAVEERSNGWWVLSLAHINLSLTSSSSNQLSILISNQKSRVTKVHILICILVRSINYSEFGIMRSSGQWGNCEPQKEGGMIWVTL